MRLLRCAGVVVKPQSLFDIQGKPIHDYERQYRGVLVTALHQRISSRFAFSLTLNISGSSEIMI